MGRFLTMLEVSQKQAYIFASNKLQDNVVNSAVIAEVLGAEYIEMVLKEVGYTDGTNMVYAGGGHTILEFDSREFAVQATKILTKKIYTDFEGLEVFAKTVAYDETKTPADNLQELTEAMERKKSVRTSSFHRMNFGIERIDANTLDVKRTIISDEAEEGKAKVKAKEFKTEQSFYPEYTAVTKFQELGGEKGVSNFIAVVHIDGNGMGKRVSELYKKLEGCSWEDFKKKIRAFSEGIDGDFKDAFKDMAKEVGSKLLQPGDKFPIRRLITAGDDICFVTEGKIGVECAVKYIEALTKKTRRNAVDENGYHACAGVAIVHQKYPFFKAYELAELLCSNAKKYGAKVSPKDNGASVSAIDWHVEFGEIKDTLEEIRADYKTMDDNSLTVRPYVVDYVEKEQLPVIKRYESFKALIQIIQQQQQEYGTGKLKGLRAALKQGEVATKNYMISNRLEGLLANTHMGDIDYSKLFTGEATKRNNFVELDGTQKVSYLFDAIEMMDTYKALED